MVRELLNDAFGAMDIERLESYDSVIEEGVGHSVQSALIDLIATKRSLDSLTAVVGGVGLRTPGAHLLTHHLIPATARPKTSASRP